MTLAKRLKAMHQPKYQKDGDPLTSGPGFGISVHPDVLKLPYRWRSPKTVFVNSMSDLFHNEVPIEFIQQVFRVMEDTPQHTYQILTKRSQRLERIAASLPWPKNVWMGVSVETQKYSFRIRHLLEVPAAIRFLSVEPLLEPVELELSGVDWVIVGGESGAEARPIDPDWVRSIRDQCRESQTAFFFKQWGGRTPKQNGRELDGRTWSEYPRNRVTDVS
jgi:protein gp37